MSSKNDSIFISNNYQNVNDDAPQDLTVLKDESIQNDETNDETMHNSVEVGELSLSLKKSF